MNTMKIEQFIKEWCDAGHNVTVLTSDHPNDCEIGREICKQAIYETREDGNGVTLNFTRVLHKIDPNMQGIWYQFTE